MAGEGGGEEVAAKGGGQGVAAERHTACVVYIDRCAPVPGALSARLV